MSTNTPVGKLVFATNDLTAGKTTTQFRVDTGMNGTTVTSYDGRSQTPPVQVVTNDNFTEVTFKNVNLALTLGPMWRDYDLFSLQLTNVLTDFVYSGAAANTSYNTTDSQRFGISLNDRSCYWTLQGPTFVSSNSIPEACIGSMQIPTSDIYAANQVVGFHYNQALAPRIIFLKTDADTVDFTIRWRRVIDDSLLKFATGTGNSFGGSVFYALPNWQMWFDIEPVENTHYSYRQTLNRNRN